MKNFLTKLWVKKGGQGLVEYGLILVLVALAVITVLGLLGDQLDTVFDQIITGLTPV